VKQREGKAAGLRLGSLGLSLMLAVTAVPAAEPATHNVALGGQCALGWVYGHRILTDCSITWQDTREQRTYCFTTRTARERFVKAARENIERAQAHFSAARDPTIGSASAAGTSDAVAAPPVN
jgi:hypothetical protein